MRLEFLYRRLKVFLPEEFTNFADKSLVLKFNLKMLKMIDSTAIKTEPGAENVPQMCRLCLSEECLDNIFKEEALQRWIMEFLSITITPSDRMSQTICTICRIRLIEFHQFRLRCQEVQSVLQSMSQNNNNGPGSESDQPTPREHECKDCGKSFAVRDHLDNHMKIHTKLIQKDEQNLLVKLREVKTELFDNVEVPKPIFALQAPQPLQNNHSNEESHLVDSSLQINHEETGTEQSIATEDLIDIQEVKIEARTDDIVDLGTALLHEPSQTKRKEFISGVASVQCKICFNFYKTKRDLWRHNRSVHGPKNHECIPCEVSFSITNDFKRHQLTKKHLTKLQHNKSTDFSIDLEHEERSNRNEDSAVDQMSKEKNKPCDDKQWKCRVCGKIYESEINLIQHQRYHGTKKFLCPICEKPFINRFVMRRHEKTHDPARLRKPAKPAQTGDDIERPYECDICQKKFKLKDTIYGHKQKVHGPKIHGCHMCDTKFSTREHLLRHVRRHYRGDQEDFLMSQQVNTTDKNDTNSTKESDVPQSTTSSQAEPKNFKCMKCDKAFKTQNRLWVHHKRGHRQRHTCSSCDVVLETKKQLAAHVATEHRPNIDTNPSSESFSCKLCNRTYPTQKQQILHMKAHAPQKYSCQICGKKYSVRACLVNHMSHTHGETVKSNKRKQSFKGSNSDSDGNSDFSDTESTSEDEQSEQSTENVTPSRKQPRRGTHEQTRSKIRAAYED